MEKKRERSIRENVRNRDLPQQWTPKNVYVNE